MEYVNFGSAGIKVSPLAVGMGLRGQDDEKHAQLMIEHALHCGINLIDCANVYGTLDQLENAGQSETILGRTLKGRRDKHNARNILSVQIFERVRNSTASGGETCLN